MKRSKFLKLYILGLSALVPVNHCLADQNNNLQSSISNRYIGAMTIYADGKQVAKGEKLIVEPDNQGGIIVNQASGESIRISGDIVVETVGDVLVDDNIVTSGNYLAPVSQGPLVGKFENLSQAEVASKELVKSSPSKAQEFAKALEQFKALSSLPQREFTRGSTENEGKILIHSLGEAQWFNPVSKDSDEVVDLGGSGVIEFTEDNVPGTSYKYSDFEKLKFTGLNRETIGNPENEGKELVTSGFGDAQWITPVSKDSDEVVDLGGSGVIEFTEDNVPGTSYKYSDFEKLKFTGLNRGTIGNPENEGKELVTSGFGDAQWITPVSKDSDEVVTLDGSRNIVLTEDNVPGLYPERKETSDDIIDLRGSGVIEFTEDKMTPVSKGNDEVVTLDGSRNIVLTEDNVPGLYPERKETSDDIIDLRGSGVIEFTEDNVPGTSFKYSDFEKLKFTGLNRETIGNPENEGKELVTSGFGDAQWITPVSKSSDDVIDLGGSGVIEFTEDNISRLYPELEQGSNVENPRYFKKLQSTVLNLSPEMRALIEKRRSERTK